jgi:hypothetical protein
VSVFVGVSVCERELDKESLCVCVYINYNNPSPHSPPS